jgi:hypothetical protein
MTEKQTLQAGNLQLHNEFICGTTSHHGQTQLVFGETMIKGMRKETLSVSL